MKKILIVPLIISLSLLSCVGVNSRIAKNHAKQGFNYFKKGDYDRAISECRAIEVKEGYAIAYNDRGNIYIYKGEYDRAISDSTKAIEINPEYAKAYAIRGDALQ